MTTQRSIPAMFMRGGTSRGPFFKATDMPSDVPLRDRVLLAIMGSPDRRQIDGLGGAHPLTSKVGIVGPSTTTGVDLDFRFAQLQPTSDRVATTANCGNMLAAVVPFAIECGMVTPHGDTTTLRVLTLNTGMQADITVQTPLAPSGRRYITYEGDASIDGVPGTSAPIVINFRNTAGSVCTGLLPTGHVRDSFHIEPAAGDAFAALDIDATCIDNGMPVVLFRARDVGRTGHEAPAQLNVDAELKARVEALRLLAARAMGLGDVTERNYPKMTLVAEPRAGGAIDTRCFIPRVCHDALGVLAGVTIATACVMEGSVAHDLAVIPQGSRKNVALEHPSGVLDVDMAFDPDDRQKVTRAAILRTARLIMRGEVMIPDAVWPQENVSRVEQRVQGAHA